jgi:hypothetical protein
LPVKRIKVRLLLKHIRVKIYAQAINNRFFRSGRVADVISQELIRSDKAPKKVGEKSELVCFRYYIHF